MEDDEDSDENGAGEQCDGKSQPVRDGEGEIHGHPKCDVGANRVDDLPGSSWRGGFGMWVDNFFPLFN